MMLKRIFLVSAMVVVLSGSMVVGSWAQQQPGSNGGCIEDVKKFCGNVERGGGRILACLNEHSKEISPSCKETLASTRRRLAALNETCGADMDKFCSGVQSGGGRLLGCLRGHSGELSPRCAEMIQLREDNAR